MKLCSRCIQLTGLTIEFPIALKVHTGCDVCKSEVKKSFDIIAVIEQAVIVK